MKILQTDRRERNRDRESKELERGRGRRWHCGKKSATKLI